MARRTRFGKVVLRHEGHRLVVLRGNFMKEPLADVLDRGMRNKWLCPYRDECIIGEHKEFIRFHNKAVEDYLSISPLLPVPYEQGFGRTGAI